MTVAVLPEPGEADVRLDPKDLEVKTTRGSGNGGQNRNKLETCVVMRHIPSGLTVRCENERSQGQNKADALALLRARLWQQEQERLDGSRQSIRRGQVGTGMRGDKVRTIRCQDGVVTDHVTGKRWRLREYLRGDW